MRAACVYLANTYCTIKGARGYKFPSDGCDVQFVYYSLLISPMYLFVSLFDPSRLDLCCPVFLYLILQIGTTLIYRFRFKVELFDSLLLGIIFFLQILLPRRGGLGGGRRLCIRPAAGFAAEAAAAKYLAETAATCRRWE